MVGIRVTMVATQGVIRHGQNMALPALLLDAHSLIDG